MAVTSRRQVSLSSLVHRRAVRRFCTIFQVLDCLSGRSVKRHGLYICGLPEKTFFLQIPINLVNSNVYAYFDLTMNFAKSKAGSMVPLF